MELFDGAGGVKALGEQNDAVQKEEGGDAVDDVLHELDSAEETKRFHRCYCFGVFSFCSDHLEHLLSEITSVCVCVCVCVCVSVRVSVRERVCESVCMSVNESV